MNEIGKVIRLATPILLMAIGGGWIPDMVQSGISGDKTWVQVMPYILTGLVLFLGGAYWAYCQSRDYLPCRVLDRINAIQPRKVLVTTLSTRRGYELKVPEDQDEQIQILPQDDRCPSFTLSGKIEEDIKSSKFIWNWQQVLRALTPHVDGNILKRVHLIGSSGDTGSALQLEECKKFLGRYLGDGIEITCDPNAVEFEDIDMLIKHLKAVIKKLRRENYPAEDIMIDTTGGMKTTSIAAAMVTLNNPDLHFQYVPTASKDFKPFAFNVVTETPAKIS